MKVTFLVLLSFFSDFAHAIVGGTRVHVAANPIAAEIVFIHIATPERVKHCTGVFIGEQIVLTAAHCLQGVKTAKLNPFDYRYLKLGILDRPAIGVESYWKTDERGVPAGAIFSTETYEIPSNYMDPAVHFLKANNKVFADIALLKLNQPRVRPAGEVVQPQQVLLAPRDPKPELLVMSFGFGQSAPPPDKIDPNFSSDDFYGMQSIILQVLNQSLNFQKTGFQAPIDSVVLGPVDSTKKQSLCHGDSGGPALARAQGKWYVVGVTSYGRGRCDSSNALTSVKFHSGWIREVAKKWNTPLFSE